MSTEQRQNDGDKEGREGEVPPREDEREEGGQQKDREGIGPDADEDEIANAGEG
jgi:hypothetical protein